MCEVHVVTAACECQQITAVLHACVDLSYGDPGLPVSLSALSPEDSSREGHLRAVIEELWQMSVSDETTNFFFFFLIFRQFYL